jgi:hypothetical protein
MGMFDYVRVDVPLPDGFKVAPGEEDFAFQTKDMDRLLNSLWITSDGRLKILLYDLVVDDGFNEFAGVKLPKFKRENEHWEEYTDQHGKLFTGSFTFYTYRGDKWHEYTAYFVDGQLREILGGSEPLRD